MCYACGSKNAAGLRMAFEHPEKHLLTSKVIFEKHHQGYKDIVHGGLMATVLDEMMVNLCWKEKTPAVTAELKVRLKKPAKVGQTIRFEGRIREEKGRAIYTTAEARDESGELLAEADAVCIKIPPVVD
jgi:acyl-coenzyme A thioesterase PaaI-like protein